MRPINVRMSDDKGENEIRSNVEDKDDRIDDRTIN